MHESRFSGTWYSGRFNPRPPFPEGDASVLSAKPSSTRVSIHALRFQRAMQKSSIGLTELHLFQSTPSVSRGRCADFLDLDAAALRVSIHALRFQRAMHRGHPGDPCVAEFQSTPSVSRGRCPHRLGCTRRRYVSIHALRFQRAMQALWTCSVSRKLFQSTPSVSRGRCHVQQRASRQAEGFNPRPPFPEGDALRRRQMGQ